MKLLSQDLYKKSNISLSSLEYPGGNSQGEKAQKNVQKYGSLRNLMHVRRSAAGSDMHSIASDASGDRVEHVGIVGSTLMDSSAFQASEDYFSEEKMTERLKIYAKQGGIPQDYIDRYAEYTKNRNSKPQSNSGTGNA